MDEGTHKFMEMMLRYENLLIMFGAWVAVGVMGKIKPLKESSLWARIVPFMPFVFTAGFSFLPGLLPEGTGMGERAMLGLILGWGSGHTHKILKQTVFGKDSRIH